MRKHKRRARLLFTLNVMYAYELLGIGTALGHLRRIMKHFSTLVPLTAILCLLAFPLLIGDSTIESIAVTVLLLTTAAIAWNIFSGFTGYISLGHATYYGIGAYVLALACQYGHISGGWGPFLLLPLAGLVTGIFAIPIGWIVLRVQRYTFLVLTLSFFFIFQSLAYNLQGLTGGSAGIFLPIPDWSVDLFDLPFYYLACAILLLVILLSWWILHSRFGLEILAIRDDEDRVRGLGINIGRYKLGAYVLSAALFGILGAITIYFLGSVTPSVAFDPELNLTVVVICFLGGIGTVSGPIIGGLLLVPIQAVLIQQFGSVITGLNEILLGGFLLIIILLLPRGIIPTLSKHWQKWQVSFHKQQLQIGITEMSTSSAAKLLAAPLHAVIELPDDIKVTSTNNQSIRIEQAIHGNPWVYSTPLIIQSDVVRRPATILYKARERRLVPFSGSKSLPSPEKALSTPAVSWRCPECRKPFMLRGSICYCPRCGITRQLIEGIS